MIKRPVEAGKSAIKVLKVHAPNELDLAKKIRYEVFVIGQNVPVEEEIDEFEDESFHFLALMDEQPCGAARWRYTASGVKLERFAVLDEFRGRGIGSALVKHVLQDIESNPKSTGKNLYLHAQLSALRLYSKFGFKQVGELFQECEIDHYKMVK